MTESVQDTATMLMTAGTSVWHLVGYGSYTKVVAVPGGLMHCGLLLSWLDA